MASLNAVTSGDAGAQLGEAYAHGRHRATGQLVTQPPLRAALVASRSTLVLTGPQSWLVASCASSSELSASGVEWR